MTERFKFGENWEKFLQSINDDLIEQATSSFVNFTKCNRLDGTLFLDIGCGSGLSSLVAKKLGACVHSFDFDETSVKCTQSLKEKTFSNDKMWSIESGSVLDKNYLTSLGKFQFVYSWGVLHHTGDMWNAISNAAHLVKDGGYFFIAIYNDQGRTSQLWTRIKKIYCSLPDWLKWSVLMPCAMRIWGPTLIKDTLKGSPLKTWKSYGKERGMSPWRDVVDWVGGYPFEVASPEAVFSHVREMGFELLNLKTCGGGYGCNEFFFIKK